MSPKRGIAVLLLIGALVLLRHSALLVVEAQRFAPEECMDVGDVQEGEGFTLDGPSSCLLSRRDPHTDDEVRVHLPATAAAQREALVSAVLAAAAVAGAVSIWRRGASSAGPVGRT